MKLQRLAFAVSETAPEPLKRPEAEVLYPEVAQVNLRGEDDERQDDPEGWPHPPVEAEAVGIRRAWCRRAFAKSSC